MAASTGEPTFRRSRSTTTWTCSPRTGPTSGFPSGEKVNGPLTIKNVPFDPERDFVPVSMIAAAPFLLVVHPSIPATTLPELIAYLKANPDKVTYGSAGSGTGSHLVVELFQKATGTKMTHVPFRNTADNANALAGGHVQLAMDVISILLPQAQSGSLRAIAVTSKDRIPGAPEIPTVPRPSTASRS